MPKGGAEQFGTSFLSFLHLCFDQSDTLSQSRKVRSLRLLHDFVEGGLQGSFAKVGQSLKYCDHADQTNLQSHGNQHDRSVVSIHPGRHLIRP